ncbi:MAG: flavin reductase family protein [Epsilonproteobacteria bacterium]|nr:flavin reductase family protein [Campylobacterota bacterium]
MLFDYEKIEPSLRYKLMAGSIIPRPIAWIVSKNEKGVINIAPFSYFTALSSNPPTLIVSIGHKSDKTPKDTLKNIRDSKICTLCLVSQEDLKPMHYSSKELDGDTSEADIFHIETKEIEKDFPPIIKSTPVAFFCKLYQEVDLKGSKTIPLILKIKKEYIKDEFVDDDLRVDYNPVARLGGEYAFLSKHIKAPRIP